MRLSSVLGAALLVGFGLDCADADADANANAALPRGKENRGSAEFLVVRDTPDETQVSEQGRFRASALLLPLGDADADADGMAPGTRYAALSPEACAAALEARGIRHEALAPRLGIASPVRLRGALSGVGFRTLWSASERARTSFEIFDCRLVLALDDLAKLLRARGIIDVMLFSAYRPPPAGWSEQVGLRHEGGLAIDIGYFGKANGTALNVQWDFKPRPRERICAPGPPPREATPSSIELRSIACEAASAGIFHLTLTPAYDRVHRDHFHLELTPGKTDFVAR